MFRFTGGAMPWRDNERDVREYLEVLHQAERLPEPKGARSRRRRQKQVFEMFAELRRKQEERDAQF